MLHPCVAKSYNKMKQYIYRADQIGLDAWPDGTLRLEGIEVTDDPNEADIFVCPGSLSSVHKQLAEFPFMEGRESRHVFLDISEHITSPLQRPCMFIRCAMPQSVLNVDTGSLSWPWPVEHYDDIVDLPEGGFKYDVSHHAWMSSEARVESSKSCRENADLTCDIAEYPDFTGSIYHSPEGVRRRAEFRRSMQESRVMLCPESLRGVFPYRFFEAMSAGRVPLLVSSDYALPWRDQIPYEQFCLFLPSEFAANAGSLIREFIRNASDEEIVRMGRMGRDYYLRYLDRDKWGALMTEAVLLKLGVQCES